MRALSLFWWVALGAGCNATFPVDVGIGAANYQPLAAGGAVGIVHGIQGGYHIWTAVRIHGSVTAAEVNLSARFEATGDAIGPASHWPVDLIPEADGTTQVAGLRNFVDRPDQVQGQRVVIHVDVIAHDWSTGTAELVVIPGTVAPQ